MIRVTAFLWLFASTVGMPWAAWAQQSGSETVKSPSGVALEMIVMVEQAITGVAEEMPDDKYEFVPTTGAFRGVRTFSRQVKHAAAVQHLVAATILGEKVTADMADERGPDTVRTKAEVLQYLKESFTALKRAAATLNQTNAFEAYKGPFGETANTRLGSITLAVSHSWNHYGQVVPYLRMNGLTPPRTP